jgi:diacylglycerol kinase
MTERPFMRAFADAADGILTVLREQRNFRIQLFIAIVVAGAAAWLHFDAMRWAVILLAIGFVLAAELANTALERAVDCASPEHSELARAAKHAGAGAVLVAALISVGVGVALFGPWAWQR